MRLKILFVLLIGWGSLWAVRPDIREKINWVDFMERQDMTWEVLPKYWYEAPFMGNGTLGLMIYQEPGQNCIRLETGNSDAHDHRPERGTYGTPHLMTGHFALRPQGEILSGNMRLRLWDALTEAEIIPLLSMRKLPLQKQAARATQACRMRSMLFPAQEK